MSIVIYAIATLFYRLLGLRPDPKPATVTPLRRRQLDRFIRNHQVH